jgi:hypothetical protein
MKPPAVRCSRGARVGPMHGLSPLVEAITAGKDRAMIDLLLATGAGINTADSTGTTLLDDTDLVQYLTTEAPARLC